MKNVKLISLVDPGKLNEERIFFSVNGIDNIGKYIVLYTIENVPGKVSSKAKNFYWFPDQDVKAGDFILLYTGEGTNTKYENSYGTTTYRFYWGLTDTIINHAKDSVALLKIESWEFKSRE